MHSVSKEIKILQYNSHRQFKYMYMMCKLPTKQYCQINHFQPEVQITQAKTLCDIVDEDTKEYKIPTSPLHSLYGLTISNGQSLAMINVQCL